MAETIEGALINPEEIDPVLSINSEGAQTPVLHLFHEHGGDVSGQEAGQGIEDHNLKQLLKRQISSMSALIAAINSQKERRFVWPLYVLVPVVDQYRHFPALEDGIWLLDNLTYWGAPTNAADITVSLTMEGAGTGIPLPLKLLKADLSTRPLGMPLMDNMQFTWTPTGTANDRGIILPQFRRVA